MMTRRSVFEEAGGFDQGFAVSYNDIDYCLKVWAHGYRVVFTPYAELRHFESVSIPRASLVTPAERQRLTDKWGEVLERDPYYSPLFG